ncbi:Ribonuclease P protein component [Qipengyuania citrea LAMA 915]|uniref:Ribonuclease P protein component n=1 Tax=Qipengyuania citrea LAMA 915 TaxID=1306953 RepID=A0A0L1KGZ5_9SPHN|nr:Ribonuclease P protein component [Qipengyuania citrea LAMA 915]
MGSPLRVYVRIRAKMGPGFGRRQAGYGDTEVTARNHR